MKKSILIFLILIVFSITTYSQNNKLIGSYWDGNKEIFTSLDIATKTFTDVAILNGVYSRKMGESTFDAKNNRFFFISTQFGITVVDAQTGTILDTIYDSIDIKGIEYDSKNERLLGVYWNGNAEIFTSLDISTKTFTDIAILHGVYSLKVGESTFDAKNNRYFFNSMELGIVVVDAQTGTILATIDDTINIKGIEYDSKNEKLVGMYWNGNAEVFTSLDISTKTFTDLAILHGVYSRKAGESTYNEKNNKYCFISPELGITMVNTQTGEITETINNSIYLKGIEFAPIKNTAAETVPISIWSIMASFGLIAILYLFRMRK